MSMPDGTWPKHFLPEVNVDSDPGSQGSRSETLKRAPLVTSATCYVKIILSDLLYKQATVNFHGEWLKRGDVTLLHCATLTMYCKGARMCLLPWSRFG